MHLGDGNFFLHFENVTFAIVRRRGQIFNFGKVFSMKPRDHRTADVQRNLALPEMPFASASGLCFRLQKICTSFGGVKKGFRGIVELVWHYASTL